MPGRLPRRSWLNAALTLLIILQATTPAWAWGRLGHRVISRLAKKNLTPKAKAAISTVLDEGETSPMPRHGPMSTAGRCPRPLPGATSTSP